MSDLARSIWGVATFKAKSLDEVSARIHRIVCPSTDVKSKRGEIPMPIMTKGEAIACLETARDFVCHCGGAGSAMAEVLRMAMAALSRDDELEVRNCAEWPDYSFKCSACEKEFYYNPRDGIYKYRPNCGRKTTEVERDEVKYG